MRKFSWKLDKVKEITRIHKGVFWKNSKSTLMIISQDSEEFFELWDLFDHRKSPCGHWAQLKRYFDEELEAFLETIGEESEEATFINAIFSRYLKTIEKGENRPVLGVNNRVKKGWKKKASK